MEQSPWKLIVAQLVNKFSTFYENPRFVAMFTRVRHWTLLWARWIRFIYSHCIYLRSILRLSFHLRLGLPSGLFPSFFQAKILCFSHLTLACYMTGPCRPPWFYHLSNIWRSLQVTKLLVVQSSPASCHFLCLRSKYSPQHPLLIGPIQAPIQWVPGALSLGVKRPRREADHSPPSSAEVKEWVELYLHSPNTPSWRGAQLKHRDNFLPLRFYPNPLSSCYLVKSGVNPRVSLRKHSSSFLTPLSLSVICPVSYFHVSGCTTWWKSSVWNNHRQRGRQPTGSRRGRWSLYESPCIPVKALLLKNATCVPIFTITCVVNTIKKVENKVASVLN
jgi:hypothetical protein